MIQAEALMYITKTTIDPVAIIIVFIITYLIGCFSMSYIISKKADINLKEQGSKNYGASNTLALIGKKAGAIVLISDILKAIIAMTVSEPLYLIVSSIILNNRTRIIFPINELKLLEALTIVAVIIGHIFPIQIKFKGGKGFASYIGLVLYLSIVYRSILIIPIIAVIMAIVTNYIVAATFTVILLTPLYFIIIENNIFTAIAFTLISIIIFIKHIENIKHIKDGSEMKIREAFKNKYRQ